MYRCTRGHLQRPQVKRYLQHTALQPLELNNAPRSPPPTPPPSLTGAAHLYIMTRRLLSGCRRLSSVSIVVDVMFACSAPSTGRGIPPAKTTPHALCEAFSTNHTGDRTIFICPCSYLIVRQLYVVVADLWRAPTQRLPA